MCTIIKVKRKITDDPVDCLILECKKKKIFLDQTSGLNEINEETVNNKSDLNDSKSFQFNSDRIDSIKQILKYAGSAKSENDIKETLLELSSRIKNYSNTNKKDLKSHFPSPTNNQLNKTNESKKELKTNRYVLLNKKRGIQNDTPMSSIKTKSFKTDLNDFNIIDVISSDYVNNETESDLFDSPSTTTSKTERLTCNGIEMIREKCVTSTAIKQPKLKETNAQIEFDSKTNEYVYDIYYTKNMDIHLDLLYPSNFEIKSATNDDKIELLDENGDEAEDFLEDDEDSNDEGNWRNDYPDEDEEDDIDNEDDDDIYRGSKNAYSKYETYDDYDDNYNEYGYGNEQDEEVDDKLTSYMKKSCNIDGSFYEDDSENDDFDEYDNETSKAYSAYKKKLIKDIDN